MNVLFEELSAPQRAGGIEAATRGLILALEAAGVKVTRRFPDSTEECGLCPDIVHVHGIWSPALMRRQFVWRKRGVPCVVTVHGMLEPWALGHKRLKKMVAWQIYQKRMLNLACALHATSPREAANLKQLGLKPRIEMIPWGIEVPGTSNIEYRSEEESCEDRSSSIGSPTPKRQRDTETPKNRTALFVGRIYPVKGLPMLVEAWEKLRPEGWKMRIVGPDEAGHLAEVERLILEAGLVGKFEFSGPLTGAALDLAYDNADLYIQPSHTENFGMAIAEAMAHGLPVITTQGAPWKLLEDENCGWWTPISTDGIAAALDDATRRSPEELAAMGERGRAIVGERFAWEAIARQFVECYQWLREEEPMQARLVK
jgi:glycosyltransferase involved in cell wall biosynthesis